MHAATMFTYRHTEHKQWQDMSVNPYKSVLGNDHMGGIFWFV